MLMFMKKIRKNKKGFTLTELIVVVAILGVLAAVATPLVANQLVNAKANADLANIRSIENAIKMAIASDTTGNYSTLDATEATAIVTASMGTVPAVKNTSSGYFMVRTTGSEVQISSAATVPDGFVKIGP